MAGSGSSDSLSANDIFDIIGTGDSNANILSLTPEDAVRAEIKSTFPGRPDYGSGLPFSTTAPGDDYTPTSSELAAQLAAQGLTNITPGTLSFEDQIAQYNNGNLSEANLDLRDIGRELQSGTLTVEDALGNGLGGFRPANVGLGRGAGFKGLEQLKAEIAEAEGTSDEGGYDRLLGYQEDNFNVVPSEMTVQQVLDFQKKRGEGSYADYSKTVNKRNNQLREDGTPKISTPVGKYQVVGSTLQGLVDSGRVDPNALFDAETQESIGEYLINETRGYNRANGPDVLDGGITQAAFEKGLGQEFQGIQKDKNFSLSSVGSANEESDKTGINQVIDDESQAQKIIADKELAAENKAIYDRGLGADDDPRRGNLSVNAAEAKYLQNLLSTLEFNDEGKLVDKGPGFIEDVFSKLVRNFTLGLVNINDLNKDKVQAVLDAYRETGSFVYDTEGNAIDLKTVEDLKKLEKLSAGEGQNPAVIGVRDKDGETISFGSDIANTSEGAVVVDDDIFSTIASTSGDDTTTTETDYTIDENGNRICNEAGYVYDVASDSCIPAVAEEESTDTSLNIGTGASRSFEDVLKNIQTKATTIAPISANIKPMAMGGMAGLNRTADNFLRALGG